MSQDPSGFSQFFGQSNAGLGRRRRGDTGDVPAPRTPRAEIERLRHELAVANAEIEQLEDENRQLRTALDEMTSNLEEAHDQLDAAHAAAEAAIVGSFEQPVPNLATAAENDDQPSQPEGEQPRESADTLARTPTGPLPSDLPESPILLAAALPSEATPPPSQASAPASDPVPADSSPPVDAGLPPEPLLLQAAPPLPLIERAQAESEAGDEASVEATAPQEAASDAATSGTPRAPSPEQAPVTAAGSTAPGPRQPQPEALPGSREGGGRSADEPGGQAEATPVAHPPQGPPAVPRPRPRLRPIPVVPKAQDRSQRRKAARKKVRASPSSYAPPAANIDWTPEQPQTNPMTYVALIAGLLIALGITVMAGLRVLDEVRNAGQPPVPVESSAGDSSGTAPTGRGERAPAGRGERAPAAR